MLMLAQLAPPVPFLDVADTPVEALRVVSREAPPDDGDIADRPRHGEVLAVRLSPGCPSCGRNHAVVFRLLREGMPPDAPLVCLGCCAKVN
jgi:hypothetical protein